MKKENEARELLRNFIKNNMDAFYDDSQLKDDENIFEKGFVSSLFAMRLLTFLEETFSIEVPDDMIQISNFSSIDNAISMVKELNGIEN